MQKESVSRAQGTIEYVVLLAIIVVIGLVIVVLSSSFMSSAPNISKGKGELYWSSQDLGIVNSAVDSNGGGVFKFSNNGVEDVTVTGLNVDGADVNVSSAKILGGGSSNVSVSGLPPCIGDLRTYSLRVTYRDQYGVLRTTNGSDLVVPCSSSDVNGGGGSTDDYVPGDTSPPSVELVSPSDSSVDDDGGVVFSFVVFDDNAVSSCSLLIDGDVNQTISSPSFGLNTFGSSVHFASEGIHYWDVNCVDRNFNWADNNSGAQWDVNY
ncbi:MAG: hypothetical protein WC308_00005, partial [archaeon]